MPAARIMTTIMLSGGFGGLAAVLLLTHLKQEGPVDQASAAPAPIARVVVEGGMHKFRIDRSADLSFRAPASIASQPVNFLIDTGANVTVLTRADAIATGLINAVKYDNIDVSGISRSVHRLHSVGPQTITIGDIAITDLPVAIDESGELPQSILGQDAFCNFSRITIEKNQIELMHEGPTVSGCSKNI